MLLVFLLSHSDSNFIGMFVILLNIFTRECYYFPSAHTWIGKRPIHSFNYYTKSFFLSIIIIWIPERVKFILTLYYFSALLSRKTAITMSIKTMNKRGGKMRYSVQTWPWHIPYHPKWKMKLRSLLYRWLLSTLLFTQHKKA